PLFVVPLLAAPLFLLSWLPQAARDRTIAAAVRKIASFFFIRSPSFSWSAPMALEVVFAEKRILPLAFFCKTPSFFVSGDKTLYSSDVCCCLCADHKLSPSPGSRGFGRPAAAAPSPAPGPPGPRG